MVLQSGGIKFPGGTNKSSDDGSNCCYDSNQSPYKRKPQPLQQAARRVVNSLTAFRFPSYGMEVTTSLAMETTTESLPISEAPKAADLRSATQAFQPWKHW